MNKKVLITGASSGLGEGMAREFAKRGYDLALAARRLDKLSVLQQELQAQGATVIVKQLDVAQYDEVFKVVEEVRDELGRIDIAVVNAGVGSAALIGTGKFAESRKAIDVGLTGAIATIEAVLPIMRKQGGGQIVGISSVALSRGLPKSGSYAAVKAGLNRFMQALRAETHGEPITVTELAPGYIDTAINKELTNKPFIITMEKGARIMTDMIERKVGFRYVPVWPWTLMALISKIMPYSVAARQDPEG